MKTTVFRRRSLPRWGRRRIRWLSTRKPLTAGTVSLTSKTNTTVNLSATNATGGTGAGTYTYQWYRDTSPGFTPSGANDIVGATALTLNDSGLAANTTYYYRLGYTDGESSLVYATEFPVTTDYSGGTGSVSIFRSSIIAGTVGAI